MSALSPALQLLQAERASELRQLLSHRIGKASGVHEAGLVAATLLNGRLIRKAIEALRMEGMHICGKPDTGYYIAATPDELEETIVFLEKRAVKSFRQIAAMKRVGLQALYQQMSLRESEDSTEPTHPQSLHHGENTNGHRQTQNRRANRQLRITG